MSVEIPFITSLPAGHRTPCLLATLLFCACTAVPVAGQTRTIGLISGDARACPGYTLFAPMQSTTTYLIDNEGRLVHTWNGTCKPGHAVYLLENGHLLRTGIRDPGRPGSGGLIEEVDWDGTVLWSVTDEEGGYEFHHDLTKLPNGNVLAIAWETKTRQEAVDAGRDPRFLGADFFKPDVILEFKPNAAGSAEIVWEWHFWDHMSCSRSGSWTANGKPVGDDILAPGRLDINFIKAGQPDWLHCNAIDYHQGFDQVVICGHNTGEFYVISHGTVNYNDPSAGVEAARGPEGDFLYRWGNPAAYGMGTAQDKRLFGQHDIQWIRDGLAGAGHFLLFNNGLSRPDGPYSTVEEIVPPVRPDGSYRYETGRAFAPDSVLWTYKAANPTDFYSQNISSAQRLPNGNTLVCTGASGIFFETTPTGDIVWKYVNPVNAAGPQVQGTAIENNLVFKCRRYPEEYPGLQGRDLTPGDPIELSTTSAAGVPAATTSMSLTSYPNPASAGATIRFVLPVRQHITLGVFDMLGRKVATLADVYLESGMHEYRLASSGFARGRYVVRLFTQTSAACQSLQIVH